MNKYVCLYFDEHKNRFYLIQDSLGEIYFIYWYELKKHGIRALKVGETFDAELNFLGVKNNSRSIKVERVDDLRAASDYVVGKSTILVENKSFSESELKKAGDITNSLTIFIRCSFDEIEIEQKTFYENIVFIDCTFNDNFRLLDCSFKKSLWMPNCKFTKNFSLKNSICEKNVHLEGADFSGVGGASFRGLNVCNIYLDLGVVGCNDVFWFNEMTVSGCIALGGDFKGKLQFLANQGGEENIDVNRMICINDISLGVELYPFEEVNKTTISGDVVIEGYDIFGAISAGDFCADNLMIYSCNIGSLDVKNVSLTRDMVVNKSRFLSLNPRNSFSLTGSSIGRHLKIDFNDFLGRLSLDETAVSENTYFEDNNIPKKSSISLHRFTTSRFLINPAQMLFGQGDKRFFKPKEFMVLKEVDSKKLGEQYCVLKKWLSDIGQLELEDVAYFHMRHHQNPNKFTRVLMGGVFGWGVRLTNIAISSFVLNIIFSFVYYFVINKASWSNSIALSLQSFISSFFGEWQGYPANGVVANIVTFHSFLGIVFITVFIGAYIRKLLR